MSGAISATATPPQTQRAIVRTVQSERLFYVVAGSVMLIATGFVHFLPMARLLEEAKSRGRLSPGRYSWSCHVQLGMPVSGAERVHFERKPATSHANRCG